MAHKEQEVHSLAIGDYVLFARKKPGPSLFNDDLGREGHISGVTMTQGQLEYAFEGRAWFPHSCFDLILRATPEALKHVARINCEDDEDEDDSDVYNAEDPAHPMDEAVTWFTALDFNVTAVIAGTDKISVKSDVSLYELFSKTTTFEINEPEAETSHHTAYVQGAELRLTFVFESPFACLVHFSTEDGDDLDEVTSDMLDEFDAFKL